jgi:hypothetical protein
MKKFLLCITLAALSTAISYGQQSSATNAEAKTPQELADAVVKAFASGSAEDFSRLVPDPIAQAVVERAIKDKAARHGNIARVISQNSEHAVLLLTGTAVYRSSGEETTRSREFSGIYEAQQTGGVWKIARHDRIDDENHITSHVVQATITPGQQVVVKDDVGLAVGSAHGFAVRLNDRANLTQVSLNGRPAKYEFGGGVLWVDTNPQAHAQLSLAYSLPANQRGPNATASQPAAENPVPAASVSPAHGEFLNTDVWMPLFDFDSANGTAPISVTATIPAEYFLTTSIPQTDAVSDGIRTVKGQTDEPEFTLSLIFDREWHPTIVKIGDIQFGTFLTSNFHWAPEKLEALLRDEYQMLVPRFGPPQSHYLAVAEDREIGESGFRFRTNDLVVAGQGGGKTLLVGKDEAASSPSAPFPHEVAHGWTMQASGPAANTLREGWATFCEWSFLVHEYGPEIEHGIWETGWNDYILGQHNGVRSILGNPGNGSIHYAKGAMILHMLEVLMGKKTFDQGMREYIMTPRDKPAGYEEFIAALSHVAGHDMTSFIMPWLTGKYIPDIQARVEGSQIIVTQSQPDTVFNLPLKLALTTASGKTVTRTIQLGNRSDALNIADLGSVTSVRIDPDHELLIQRHFGENIHFELRAPDAKNVALTGNFSVKPVPATHTGEVWALDVPFSEGRYSWAWQVDGKILESSLDGQQPSGVRIVQALKPVEAAYPK